MNQPIKLYYLYCLNVQCKESIYHCMKELQVPLDAKNLFKKHQCACCHEPLVSAIDIAIENVVTEAEFQKTHRPSFLSN